MQGSTKRLDIIATTASLIVIGLSLIWLMQTDALRFALDRDPKLIWHLVRSSGVVAYVLLLCSTVWGLLLSSQFVKNWSPGPISMTLHSALSWLALLLSLIHALLLLLDDYFVYTLDTIFIPFTGPYRPEWVGLGTLSFWCLLAVTLSFPLKKWIGRVAWKRLHYTTYAAFALVSIHGLMAGTDGDLFGLRVLMAGGVLIVVLLLGIRLGKDQTKSPTARSKPTA